MSQLRCVVTPSVITSVTADYNSHGQQGQIGRTAEAVEARARHRGGGNGAAQQEQEEAGTSHHIVRIPLM